MEHQVVVLNAGKMNYDGALDFQTLSKNVTVYEDSAPEEIVPRVGNAPCIVTKELALTKEQIAAFPDSLKLIVEAGTGYNNIPIDAAGERGITVCNVPAYSTQRVAHTALMLMLNLASTMQTQIGMLKAGNHDNFTARLMVPHIELNGKTLGIVGAGNIGVALMNIALAMEMNILVHTRTPREDRERVRFVPLATLLKESDFISLHCPLTDATRHIIDANALAAMKPTAFLVNTSRGALIDEPALIRALQERRIAGAGLDVQETEPPAADNPLYSLENVILTPHMGWKGKETRERLLRVVRDDIAGFFAGKPVNVVT